jgi:hypothetical protein
MNAHIARLFLLLLLSLFSLAAHCEQIVEADMCRLLEDPSHYNQQLIKVAGVVTQGFEDFTLSGPSCNNKHPIWLEYGGTRQSATIYCCGISAGKTRPEPLIVEGVSTSLDDNEVFERFDKMIHAGSRIKATLIGRFFSGTATRRPGGTFWTGYGHMGMYSLLVIQEVSEMVEADDQTASHE